MYIPKHTYSYILFICLLFTLSGASAQRLDPTFEANLQAKGFVFNRALLQDSSKIYVGIFSSFEQVDSLGQASSLPTNQIVKVFPNGEPDRIFNRNIEDGVKVGEVRTVVEQEDGKILIGGNFLRFNNRSIPLMVRLLPDGQIDLEFIQNLGLGFGDGSVTEIIVQRDGKIVVVGSFTSYQGLPVGNVIRLDTDGTLDQVFMNNIGTGANGTVLTVLQQDDNKLLLGGFFDSFNGIQTEELARLNPDGTLDNLFSLGFLSNPEFSTIIQTRKIRLRQNGGIFALIELINEEGNPERVFYAIDQNGILDTNHLNNFNQSFVDDFVTIFDFEILGQDRAALIGLFAIPDSINFFAQNIALLDAAGNFDPSFKLPFFENNTFNNDDFFNLSGVYLNPDNTLEVVFNAFEVNQFSEVSLNFDQTANILSRGPILTESATIQDVVEQPDGKLLVAGNFSLVDNQPVPFLARLEANGRLDTTFQTGTGPNSIVRTIALQGDNIIIGGGFGEYNGQEVTDLVRLFPDGSLDLDFIQNLGNSSNGTIQDIEVLPLRNSLLVAGDFEEFDTNQVGNYVILLEDGSYDTFNNQFLGFGFSSFNQSRVSAEIEEIALDPSNSFLILGGDFAQIGGNDTLASFDFRNLAKVLVSITDISFQANNINGDVEQVAISPNGLIAFGGDFVTVNQRFRQNLALLTSTGALVEEFDLSLEKPQEIVFQEIGEEERLLVSSRSVNLPGSLGRFNLDGSVDRSFQTNLSQQSEVTFIRVLRNNDLIININESGSLFKLVTPPEPPIPLDLRANSQNGRSITLTWSQEAPDADSLFYEIQKSTFSSGGFTTLNFTQFGQQSFEDSDVLPGQQYFYRIRTINLGNNSPFSQTVGIKISPLITSLPLGNSLAFQVYPNPNEGQFQIQGEVLRSSNAPWKGQILNTLGETMANLSEEELANQNIDLSYLPSGIYYLKLYNQSENIVLKWIKQ